MGGVKTQSRVELLAMALWRDWANSLPTCKHTARKIDKFNHLVLWKSTRGTQQPEKCLCFKDRGPGALAVSHTPHPSQGGCPSAASPPVSRRLAQLGEVGSAHTQHSSQQKRSSWRWGVGRAVGSAAWSCSCGRDGAFLGEAVCEQWGPKGARALHTVLVNPGSECTGDSNGPGRD